MESNTQKQAIIRKYEAEAEDKNNDDWLEKGDSVRVPENAASHYFIERKVSEALSLLDAELEPTANVLEVGCSFGHMTSLLAQRFNEVTAVDISPTSVEIARKRLHRYGVTNVSFVADDAETLAELPDEQYDVVFSFSTIRFCPNVAAALKSIRTKMKKEGIAIIDFPNKLSPWHLFVKTLLKIRRHVHDNLYSRSQLLSLFAGCGFEVEKTRVFLFTTKRLPSILLPFFKFMDVILERLPLIKNLGGIIMLRAKAK